MSMRTLLLGAFHGYIGKNILGSDVLKTLVQEPDLRVVVAVPEIKVGYFAEVLAPLGVEVRGIPVPAIAATRSQQWLHTLAVLCQDTHYLWYKRHERLRARRSPLKYLRHGLETLIIKLIAERRVVRRLFRRLYQRYSFAPEMEQLFDAVKPDAVFSTDIFDGTDALLNATARRNGVPVIGMVRSWDNCWSKGVLPVIPDQVITNNTTIKEEVTQMHDVPADRVFVGGTPQYDESVRGTRLSREAFFEKIGATDPSRKLLLFAPAGQLLSQTDHELLDVFVQAMDTGAFVSPVHLHVRNHPNHPMPMLVSRPHLTSEHPGISFGGRSKAQELSQDDIRHLADTLYHADVVLYVATTLGVDSLVYDKPQIILDFDGTKTLPYLQSVQRYHDEDHMKKMIACGGVRIVKSAKELIEAINAYLQNPSLDKEGRDRMRAQQLYQCDGHAGERIGAFIAAAIRQAPSRPEGDASSVRS